MVVFMTIKIPVAASIVLLFAVTGIFGQGAKATDAKVTLPANLLDYRGPCPVNIPIQGVITATGLGLIKYQFVHTSGPSGPVQRLISLGARAYDVRESTPRTYAADAPDWNDTVTLRILSGADGNLESTPVKYIGTCGRANAVPRTATVAPYLGPARGTFRVTINGFTCIAQTTDTSVLGDGAGDEIFFYTRTFNISVRPDGGQDTTSDFVQSLTYGDTGNQYQRQRAGTATANGGIKFGDSYPATPEKRSTDPHSQTIPQLVWQGTIDRFQNGVIIVPMIWEADGLTRYIGGFQNLELDATPFTFARSIRDPRIKDETALGFAFRADFDRAGELTQSVYGNPVSDAPIGERETGGGYRFKAQALFLTYDEALRLANLNRTTGKALPITYTSDPRAGGGSYTIWIQIEQLP